MTLVESLMDASPEPFSFVNLGASAQKVSDAKNTIDARLAAYDGTEPVLHVLMNWGVNDIRFEAITEVTWKANYLYIIDAVHTKWPNASIWLMRPWVINENADSDMIAGWIADVVAARSSYTFLGPDERVWLKGADNGATHTSDGVHYDRSGKIEAANQWKTTLGY